MDSIVFANVFKLEKNKDTLSRNIMSQIKPHLLNYSFINKSLFIKLFFIIGAIK